MPRLHRHPYYRRCPKLSAGRTATIAKLIEKRVARTGIEPIAAPDAPVARGEVAR